MFGKNEHFAVYCKALVRKYTRHSFLVTINKAGAKFSEELDMNRSRIGKESKNFISKFFECFHGGGTVEQLVVNTMGNWQLPRMNPYC